MGIRRNQGLLMCQEYQPGEYVKCRHFDGSTGSSYQHSRGHKTGLDTSCTAAPHGNIKGAIFG